MTPAEIVVIAVAGFVAGTINAVAGGGSLLSFPALLWLGLPPLAANVTNTVGLLPGYLGTAVAYRRELVGQRRLAVLGGLIALVGAGMGAALLLLLPPDAFTRAVPFLLVGGCVLIVVQPKLSRLLRARTGAEGARPLWAYAGILVAGAYGAYFGAGLGVLLFAVLATVLNQALQEVNAIKGWLSLLINTLAAVAFAVFGPVHWAAVLVLASTSLAGGHLGGRLARRLSDRVLRLGVLTIGIASAGWLVATS
ncbi:sulfite exporter TauE/SafE family protein [Plantactinospora soyae]|uniref:Probable membrane transporter protein n=1 Tax=Plantactinospora soyae TaxID=1544732 RepID=A0A927MDL9_9ACTN|nr:sulfite exporter TauE/SafE family protein [Plantactinospora soyae]MBE1491181.1 putative membrane protein YfcA [Plantactinospora soyae]